MLRSKQSHHQNSVGLMPELFQVELTGRAKSELAKNEKKLYVEMQLFFGCMLRKKLNFSDETPSDDFIKVGENLYVGLQAFMNGEACGITDKQIDNQWSNIVIGTPRWLKIDYKKGRWSGEFGLTEKPTLKISLGRKWLKDLFGVITKTDRKEHPKSQYHSAR